MPRSNRRWTIAGYERFCTPCQQWLPETTENFAYNTNRGLFNSWCKPCVRAHSRNVTTVGPRRGGRTFGCEIEFHGNAVDVVREMNARGVRCEVQDYNHRVSRTTWKIVPDATVSRGAELVSPVMSGEDGFEQIVKAGLALQAAGATVSRHTGLHVHHDVRNLTVTAFVKLVSNWHRSQTAIDLLVARSRREGHNTYCQPFSDYELTAIRNGLRGTSSDPDASRVSQHGMRQAVGYITRYKNLNLQSYPKYGTVEVRQHQGTTDAEKINAWVKFGQAMITAAVNDTDITATTVDELLAALPLDDETRNYLAGRAAALAR